MEKDGPYEEDDQPLPINAYGESKLIAEKAIRDRLVEHYIIRVQWVYGRKTQFYSDNHSAGQRKWRGSGG